MCVKRRAVPSGRQLEDAPDADGMNRWACILASLVTAHPDLQP